MKAVFLNYFFISKGIRLISHVELHRLGGGGGAVTDGDGAGVISDPGGSTADHAVGGHGQPGRKARDRIPQPASIEVRLS